MTESGPPLEAEAAAGRRSLARASSAAPVVPVIPVVGWSAAELATLASIAETFVRGGAVRRARLAAQAIGSLDPAEA